MILVSSTVTLRSVKIFTLCYGPCCPCIFSSPFLYLRFEGFRTQKFELWVLVHNKLEPNPYKHRYIEYKKYYETPLTLTKKKVICFWLDQDQTEVCRFLRSFFLAQLSPSLFASQSLMKRLSLSLLFWAVMWFISIRHTHTGPVGIDIPRNILNTG